MSRGIEPTEVEDGWHWSTFHEEPVLVQGMFDTRRNRRAYLSIGVRASSPLDTLDGRLIPLDLPPGEELLLLEVEPGQALVDGELVEDRLTTVPIEDLPHKVKRIPKECPECGTVFEEGGEVEA